MLSLGFEIFLITARALDQFVIVPAFFLLIVTILIMVCVLFFTKNGEQIQDALLCCSGDFRCLKI